MRKLGRRSGDGAAGGQQFRAGRAGGGRDGRGGPGERAAPGPGVLSLRGSRERSFVVISGLEHEHWGGAQHQLGGPLQTAWGLRSSRGRK